MAGQDEPSGCWAGRDKRSGTVPRPRWQGDENSSSGVRARTRSLTWACRSRGRPEAVIAIFGPTGVGKTAVAIELAERLRAEGRTRWPSRRTRSRCTAAWRSLTGVATPTEQERLEHRLLRSCRSRRRSRPASSPRSRTRRSTLRSRRDAGRSSWAAPASTSRRRSPTWSCARRRRRGCASGSRGGWTARGIEALHAELGRARARARPPAIDPADRTRVVRALELLEMGEEPAPGGDASRLWTAELRRPRCWPA